jgi:predicted amidophosphoribosyltransferase
LEWLVPLGVILFVSLWVLALMDRMRTRACPYCLRRIDREASVCPNCRSDVEPILSPMDREIRARWAAEDAARGPGREEGP